MKVSLCLLKSWSISFQIVPNTYRVCPINNEKVSKTFSKRMSITVTVTKFTVAQKTLFLLSKKLVHQFTCEKNTSSRVRQVKYHLGHAWAGRQNFYFHLKPKVWWSRDEDNHIMLTNCRNTVASKIKLYNSRQS